MKNILLLSYQISPTRGSEYAVAWNYVRVMSQYCKITVLFGSSGDYLGDCREMDLFLQSYKVENVSFVKVVPDKLTSALNFFNSRGLLKYSFYLAYKRWHKLAYKSAEKICKEEKFDIIHYLNPIGYREPGYLFKLNIPYVWGPVGGTNMVPWALFPSLSLKGKVMFSFRNVANYLQFHFSPRLHRAIKETNILLTSTIQVQKDFERVYGKHSIYLPENGIIGELSLNENKFEHAPFHFLFVGSLDERKALITTLRALSFIRNKDKVIFDVVGDGPLRSKLQKQVDAMGLGGVVVFHGAVNRSEVSDFLDKSVFQIISSVSEGNPTTIWEAMARGVPTISLDHCGMHDTLTENGILIPIDSYNQIVQRFANEIDNLVDDSRQFFVYAKGTLADAKKYLWEKRIPVFLHIYNQLSGNARE